MPPGARKEQRHVLVVDDDDDAVATLVHEVLSDSGHAAASAVHGGAVAGLMHPARQPSARPARGEAT